MYLSRFRFYFWSLEVCQCLKVMLNYMLFFLGWQIVIWFIMPAIRSSHADHTNNALVLIVLLQYVPRLYMIFPLSSQIIKTTGVVTKTAWAGAAYNLLLYMLASHVCFHQPHNSLFIIQNQLLSLGISNVYYFCRFWVHPGTCYQLKGMLLAGNPNAEMKASL